VRLEWDGDRFVAPDRPGARQAETIVVLDDGTRLALTSTCRIENVGRAVPARRPGVVRNAAGRGQPYLLPPRGWSIARPMAEAGEGGAFHRELGLLDSTMIVAGSMIGSGIYIVSADIARHVGSPGWLLMTWVITGLLTVTAALSYGELAAMMPNAGGQYVYLRESYSPLWGFLYGWTLFLVIQSGTIAAVAVGFARYLGVLVPAISPEAWIVPPIDLSSGYAISLSTQQLAAVALIALLTYLNTHGVRLGKLIQNTFTSAKTLSLLALVPSASSPAALASPGELRATVDDPRRGHRRVARLPLPAAALRRRSALGLFIALCVAQVGSIFSADAWNNITFTAGEVKDPRRNVPLSLALGTILVVGLYTMINVAYLCALPLESIQTAADDRVATAALDAILGNAGAVIMAIAIMISTFGCNNGLILAGARVYYAMAQDGLFFAPTGRLNQARVPTVGLVLQCLWASFLVLPRTRAVAPDGAVTTATSMATSSTTSSSRSSCSTSSPWRRSSSCAARSPTPRAPTAPSGYPLVPALYIALASVIMVVLILTARRRRGPAC